MLKMFASDWEAMNWYDKEGVFAYLKTKVGNASVQASRSTTVYKNGVEGESHNALPMVVPFKVALDKFRNNDSKEMQQMNADKDGNKLERKDIVSILEYEISAKARELKNDY